MQIFKSLTENKKKFAVLVDPDNYSEKELEIVVDAVENAGADYYFVGGSLLINNHLEKTIKFIKSHSSKPVILFPGDVYQVNPNADAILLLSVISGRNPEMLIGKHVMVAPYLKRSKLEILPTGYMLIDSGKPTTASYMSNTVPIPSDKSDIAVCTAMAGEMLGLKLIYMDAGSGAVHTISEKMIAEVKRNIDIPLIVGGGIRTPLQAEKSANAGADLIVVGNSIEKQPSLIKEIASAIHSL